MNTFSDELITLTRDCDATLIPYGNAFTLKKGDQVIVLAGKDKGKTGKITKVNENKEL